MNELERMWKDAYPTAEAMRAAYPEVLRTTRQRWWQFWKPRPNAMERAIIFATLEERKREHTCLYTGPEKKDHTV